MHSSNVFLCLYENKFKSRTYTGERKRERGMKLAVLTASRLWRQVNVRQQHHQKRRQQHQRLWLASARVTSKPGVTARGLSESCSSIARIHQEAASDQSGLSTRQSRHWQTAGARHTRLWRDKHRCFCKTLKRRWWWGWY